MEKSPALRKEKPNWKDSEEYICVYASPFLYLYLYAYFHSYVYEYI